MLGVALISKSWTGADKMTDPEYRQSTAPEGHASLDNKTANEVY
jgi:hypothetical protein